MLSGVDAPIRMLIVNDDAEAAEAIVSNLRNAGLAVRPARAASLDQIDEHLAAHPFDVVLVSSPATGMSDEQVVQRVSADGRDLPVAFNRKEAKTHGEGGMLIGAPLAGRRVLIVDDVITAGTAIREALALIRDAGGVPSGIVIGLDRQEIVRDGDPRSAAQGVAEEDGIPVIAVASLADLLDFSAQRPELSDYREALGAYRQRYGAGD